MGEGVERNELENSISVWMVRIPLLLFNNIFIVTIF